MACGGRRGVCVRQGGSESESPAFWRVIVMRLGGFTAFLTGLPRAIFARYLRPPSRAGGAVMISRNTDRGLRSTLLNAFLTGSAPQTEFDVTYSKQTLEKILPGARTAIRLFEIRQPGTQEIARDRGFQRVSNRNCTTNRIRRNSFKTITGDNSNRNQNRALCVPDAFAGRLFRSAVRECHASSR
jgi:hypothetical protein